MTRNLTVFFIGSLLFIFTCWLFPHPLQAQTGPNYVVVTATTDKGFVWNAVPIDKGPPRQGEVKFVDGANRTAVSGNAVLQPRSDFAHLYCNGKSVEAEIERLDERIDALEIPVRSKGRTIDSRAPLGAEALAGAVIALVCMLLGWRIWWVLGWEPNWGKRLNGGRR